MFRPISFPLVAAIGLVVATQSAFAAPHAEQVTVRRVAVQYGDLDLGTRTDARVLLTRLEKAAKRACGGDPHLNPDYSLMFGRLERAYQECRGDAVSRAVAEIDASLLTDLYRSEGTQRLARAD
jgi:UrcA family protein